MSKFISDLDQLSKQGIPLLDFSGLIKTHKTPVTKTVPTDL